MVWVVTVAPAEEPVSLADAKAHLGVTHAGDDDRLTRNIKSARQHVEAVCERALVTQTWRLSLDAFPSGCITLPGGKVSAVSSIAYTDTNGDAQALVGYQSDLDSEPARLMYAYSAGAWPGARAVLNAVQVTYVVGYGAASAVPDALKAAILLAVGDLYANREAQQDTVLAANATLDRLLWPYRCRVLA